MKSLQPLALALLLLTSFIASPVHAASTLRCGSGLVSLGDSRYQVTRICGQPVDRSAAGWREITDIYGNIREVPVEEWMYGPRNGMYHYLRFEGGVLVKIASSR
ncbi:MAG: DUF2845 domain-containing protein [Thiopseudomonas sp.]|nr:DUF2845 domain-containing protein [Thiopseudomonas sp.]